MIENSHTNRTRIFLIVGVIVIIAVCTLAITFNYKEPRAVTDNNSNIATTEVASGNLEIENKTTASEPEYTGKYQKSGKLEKVMQQIADKTETTVEETE